MSELQIGDQVQTGKTFYKMFYPHHHGSQGQCLGKDGLKKIKHDNQSALWLGGAVTTRSPLTATAWFPL